MTRPTARRIGLTLGLLMHSACSEGERASVDSAASATATTAPAAPAVAWKFATPPSWIERTRSVPIDDPERARLYPGARAVERFDYLPIDTTIVPQTLLLITVYDSTTWETMRRAEGPPVGEEITRERGNVYIASLPQSNPFPPASADAKAFDARAVTIEDVKKGFRVVQ
jgi:hypothetical protein